MKEIKKIEQVLPKQDLTFSICTIVNNFTEYEVMKNSFIENGFTDNCEYIIADNSISNQFDAYQAISKFLKIAKGEFVIIVHQDVKILDNIEKLKYCLNDLESKDPTWAICGNAGLVSFEKTAFHISHENLVQIGEDLPAKVKSLDENLLIIKSQSNLTISANLKGFHLYGTDMCIIANFLGYSAYVIEFMLIHYSRGNLGALENYKQEFIESYGDKMQLGYVQTTCTHFYLSNSKKKNIFFNKPFIFSKIRFLMVKNLTWGRWVRRKKRRVKIIYNFLFNNKKITVL